MILNSLKYAEFYWLCYFQSLWYPRGTRGWRWGSTGAHLQENIQETTVCIIL